MEPRDTTSNKSSFFKLEEQDTNMKVELGDDGRCPVVGFGIFHFVC